MVVSAEYVARQVSEVLKWREAWLKEAELPKDTVMDETQKTAFLKASKQEYHSRADQMQLQRRDWGETQKQREVDQKMKSRWSRNQQRLAGTIQMWQVLSFTERFDPKFFETVGDPPREIGKKTEEERQNTKRAVEARAARRPAIKYARVCDRGGALTRKQPDLLKQYDSGELLNQVSRLTLLSGNGRLRGSDGSHVDIGGSTGGWIRKKLYGWTPPDTKEIQLFESSEFSDFAAAEGP